MSKLENAFAQELALFSLPPAHRQFKFHPTRRWALDFAWPERKIGCEIHGGLFIPKGAGAHNRGASMEDDFEKTNEATRLGWSIFTFGPKWCYRKKSVAVPSKAIAFLIPILRS